MPAERSFLETLFLSSKHECTRRLLLVGNRGGPIERSLVLRNFPAPQARPREAPSMQLRPAPSQARPPGFLRVFFAATLAWLCLSGALLAPSPAISSTNKAQANCAGKGSGVEWSSAIPMVIWPLLRSTPPRLRHARAQNAGGTSSNPFPLRLLAPAIEAAEELVPN